MSETKHTPGPWVTTGVDVYTDAKLEDGGDIICEAPEGFEDSMRRWDANARLIAAAPDLLDALETAKRAIHEMNVMFRVVTYPRVFDKINAAIAKATGEKP